MKMVCIILLFLSLDIHAEMVTFNEIWSQIRTNSPAQQAAELQIHAAEEASSRASRHWLPRLYLDVKVYRTNDPGQSLMGLLQQRQIQANDFNPNLLNRPDATTYSRGALGLDLPLFEGGMKTAQAALYQNTVSAQKSAAKQTQIDQYAVVGKSYGSIIVLKNQIEKLNAISVEIQKLIKSYQIGQKSNPVGYSGLLGMRSLSNRITGLLEHYKSQQNAYYGTLNEMGYKNSNWTTENLRIQKFIEKYLTSITDSTSNKVQSSIENIKVAQNIAEMEKARFMPRLGAFAEGYLFNGNRDAADGYMAGLYLQWNLFDPSDFGKLKEARLKTLSGEKQVQALIQQEKSEKIIADESDKAMRINLSLIEDSDKLLSEQMNVASTLFRNGSISALQLVEILNRRTDLIAQQNELEMNLIKTVSDKITKYDFQILSQSANEVR